MRARSTSSAPADDAGARCQTSVLFELWRLSRSAGALFADALATAGMSGDEFGIYSVLDMEGRMSPTALARWMSAPATTVSSHIKRLDARGHLAKHPDPTDGRSFLLELTPSGRVAFEQASAVYVPMLDDVELRLGAREPAIRRALIALRAAVDAAGAEHASPISAEVRR